MTELAGESVTSAVFMALLDWLGWIAGTDGAWEFDDSTTGMRLVAAGWIISYSDLEAVWRLS